MKVADFGCGVGVVTRMLAQMVGPSGSVTGIDVNGDQLEEARDLCSVAGLSNTSFLEASACETGLPRESFDLVYCRFLLLHLPDPISCLIEMREVLKPGGILVVEDGDLATAGSIRRVPSTDSPTCSRGSLQAVVSIIPSHRTSIIWSAASASSIPVGNPPARRRCRRYRQASDVERGRRPDRHSSMPVSPPTNCWSRLYTKCRRRSMTRTCWSWLLGCPWSRPGRVTVDGTSGLRGTSSSQIACARRSGAVACH